MNTQELNQGLVGFGMIFFVICLALGVEAGLDFLLIGSILALSGGLGLLTDSSSAGLVSTILLSLIYVFIGRRIIRKKFSAHGQSTNIDKVIGQKGKVLQAITPDSPGLVKADDEEWRATADHVLPVGEEVIIISVQGVTVTVKKKEKTMRSE